MAEELREQMAQLTIRKRLEDAGEELLADRNITQGDTTLPNMPPVSSQQAGVRVKTNIFPIVMEKEVDIYHYHVEGRFRFKTKEVGQVRFYEYTGQRREDALMMDHIRTSRRMFLIFQKFYPSVMPREGRCIYDGASQLFTLDAMEGGAPMVQILMTIEEWPQLAKLRKNLVGVEMLFKKTERITHLGRILRSLPPRIQYNQDLAALLQFLELATSESMASNEEHSLFRNGLCMLKEALQHGYTMNDMMDLEGGGYLAYGCKKSARAMSGQGDEIKFGLVIDPKVAAIHRIELVSEKVRDEFPKIENGANGSLLNVRNLLKGIFVLPVHRNGTATPMTISDVCSQSALTKTFEKDGKTVSVAEYFKQQYNVDLKYPNMPLIIIKHRDKEEFFPMEKSTRLPQNLERDILNNLRAMGLDGSAPLSQAHLKVGEQAIEAPAHVFNPPALEYNKSKSRLNLLKGNWDNGNYYLPAEITNWAMVCVLRPNDSGGNDLTRQEVINFGMAFIHAAKKKGVKIGQPKHFEMRTVPLNGEEHTNMKDLFLNCHNTKCQFALFITGPQDGTIHDTIKFMERKHDNVLSTTAKAAAGINGAAKWQTMENIVNKSNSKNGGIDYVVSEDVANNKLGSRDLFIGFTTNIAGGGFVGDKQKPSVVGYSANDKKNPAEYTGNYVYQEALRDEKLKVIEGIVRVVVDRFKKNRGHFPDRVFLYRNSSSEGSYEHVMRFEIPLVRNVLRSTGAKLIFVVVTKMHNVRFVPAIPSVGKNAMEQNLKPGTCIDKDVTSPYIPEYFLLGHFGRLGTAKVPRYSVLCNEAEMSMEDLQRTTFFLCFGHQIVAGLTSLPSPVYISTELAKRGRLIYNVASSTGDMLTSSGEFEALTQAYDYASCERLRDLRFTA